MGFISELASAKATFPGMGRERDLWRSVFGGTTKEDGLLDKPVSARDGGNWGRSAIVNPHSFSRLLQGYRTRAPGGWSDNRREQSDHFKGITYIAVHRMGEQLAQAELRVYQKDDLHPDGKREVTKRHDPEAYKLVELLERPNKEDSFSELMYNINLQLGLTGVSLSWMVPNVLGTPMEMYPIPTVIAQPYPLTNPDYPHGYYRIQPIYPYGVFSSYPTPYSAVGAVIPAEWMLRVKYPHPYLRWDGYSPLTALRLHVDEIESVDRSRWYSMKRAIQPSAVLNFEELGPDNMLPEPEIDRIRAEFEAEIMGPENAGRLFVSAPGSKLEPWGLSPKEMEYQSGWEQLLSFIMAGYGITKQAAGMIEDSSYATLFATLKQVHLLTLGPLCVSGDTPLITKEGASRIKDYENKEVEVWNGKRWSNVTVKKTGTGRQLVRVRFSDDSYLDCTPNHRFCVSSYYEGGCRKSQWEEVEAKDLAEGMAVEPFCIQYDSGEELKDAYTLGALMGDGCIQNGRCRLQLFGEKRKLPVVGGTTKELKWSGECKQPFITVNCGDHFTDQLRGLRADDEDVWWKMFSLDRKSILAFLAGWLDTDGSNHHKSVSLSVSGRHKAEMVQLLLTKCGIRSFLSLVSRAGKKTNYGARKKDLWFVYVPDCKELPCHRLDTQRNLQPRKNAKKFQKIKSVEYLPGEHDTFCFTEPEQHKGVFGNVLTFQCHRISSMLTRDLSPFFGEGLIVEIKPQRIDDHDVANAKIGVGIQAMCLTKNEVRKQLGYPITMEPWGNEFAGMPPVMPALVPPGHDPADAMLYQQQMGMVSGMMPGMMPQQQVQGVQPGHEDELAMILGEQGAGGMGQLLPGNESPEDRRFRMTGMPGPGRLGAGGLGPRKSYSTNGKSPAGRHK